MNCRLVLLVLAALALAACNRPPVSNPTALRNTNDYGKALTGVEPGTVDWRAFDSITLSRETNRLVINQPQLNPPDQGDGFSHQLEYLKPGQSLAGASARFEVIAVGVAFPINVEADFGNESVPIDFFSLEGAKLSGAELTSIGLNQWDGSAYIYEYDKFPKLRLIIGSKENPPGYYSMAGLFDARTKHSLSSGSSYSQVSSNRPGWLEIRHRAWHATPLELVVDVQLDGQVVVATNLIPDLVIPIPGGLVKLLGTWDGRSSWSSSRSRGAGSTETFELGLEDSRGQTNSLFVFACEPPALAVHVDCLDTAGMQISERGGHGGGFIRSINLEAAAADVKHVRLTVFTNHHRIIVPLPPISGLPPENQQTADLFRVRIPRVQFKREYELREFIRDVVEMKFDYSSLGDVMPTNRFPLVFSNTTPAELLSEYRSHLPRGYTVTVDEQKQEIRVEKSRAQKLLDWVKQKLRR